MVIPLPAITQTRGELTPLLNKIHHADALELLRRLPDASIDMVLCDLPYGVTACEWDTIIPIEPMWEQLRRVVKRRAAIVLTATQPFTSRLVSSNYEMFRHEWIWDKVKPSGMQTASVKPMPCFENILCFSRDAVNYYPIMTKRIQEKRSRAYSQSKSQFVVSLDSKIRIYTDLYPKNILQFSNANQSEKEHPTQKPVALFEYLIKTYTQAGEIVLDMTCGSGTTAIAARKTGRQFICGDLSAEYVQVARTRLQNTDPFQAMLLPDGRKQLSLFEAVQ